MTWILLYRKMNDATIFNFKMREITQIDSRLSLHEDRAVKFFIPIPFGFWLSRGRA